MPGIELPTPLPQVRTTIRSTTLLLRLLLRMSYVTVPATSFREPTILSDRHDLAICRWNSTSFASWFLSTTRSFQSSLLPVHYKPQEVQEKFIDLLRKALGSTWHANKIGTMSSVKATHENVFRNSLLTRSEETTIYPTKIYSPPNWTATIASLIYYLILLQKLKCGR